MANFSFFGRGAYLVVLFVFFEISFTGPSATRKNWAPVFPQQLELLSENRCPIFPYFGGGEPYLGFLIVETLNGAPATREKWATCFPLTVSTVE